MLNINFKQQYRSLPELVLYLLIYLIMFISFLNRDLNVGSDTLSYFNDFQNLKLKNVEYGWYFLNICAKYLSGNFYVLLGICITIIISLLDRSLKYYSAYPLIALMMFLAICFALYFNILRQSIAMSMIYAFSIPYIIQKKLIKFLFSIGLAVSFHTSAIIFLPLYFFTFRLLGKKYYLIIWFISLFFLITQSLTVLDVFVSQFSKILSLYISQDYFDSIEKYVVERNYYATLMFNLFIFFPILYYNYIKENSKVVILFNIYFWGIILANLTLQHYVFERVIVYFYPAAIFLTVNLAFQLKKNKLNLASNIILIYSVIFSMFYFFKTFYFGNAGEVLNP